MVTEAQVRWNQEQKRYWTEDKPWQERFWARVDKSGDCWLWTGPVDRDGYGAAVEGTNVDGSAKIARAHRVAYKLSRGEIQSELVLDHLCNVRACVRPDHLEPVTNAENQRRSPSYKSFEGRTECFRGHSLADCYFKRDGRKICKQCMQNARLKRLGRWHEYATIDWT